MSQIIETLQLPGSTDEYQFRALKLKKTTNGIGSSNTPVYINAEGEPVACSSSITSDTKVTQTNTTDSSNYRVLFSNTADDTTRTEGARKSANLTFNPSTANLVIHNGTTGSSSSGNASLTFVRGSDSDGIYDYRLRLSNNTLYTEVLTDGVTWLTTMQMHYDATGSQTFVPLTDLEYNLGLEDYRWNWVYGNKYLIKNDSSSSNSYRNVPFTYHNNYYALGLYKTTFLFNPSTSTLKSTNYLAKGGNIKIETSSSTEGCTMVYNSTTKSLNFEF